MIAEEKCFLSVEKQEKHLGVIFNVSERKQAKEKLENLGNRKVTIYTQAASVIY